MRARIAQIADEYSLGIMATLTLDPSLIPEGERSDRYIRNCWRLMRVYLKRKFKVTIDYISVLEFHQSGIAHLHILLNTYIPQAWLSEAWMGSGGGRVVDIRRVTEVQFVAAYVAGYLAGPKITHTLSLLTKRARIFTTSRSISLWGKKEKTAWKLARLDLSTLRDLVRTVYKERYGPNEFLKPFDLELLTYFEGTLTQAALGDRDVLAALKSMLRVWKPTPEQNVLL